MWRILLLLVCLILPAKAAETSLDVLEFYVYPSDTSSFNKLAGFKWPAVETLDALVRVETTGYVGEQNVDLFLVLYDDAGQVLDKVKQKHPLPVGEHDLVVPGFVSTANHFGELVFEAEIEVSLKGARIERASQRFSLTGPAPPIVKIHDLRVFNPNGGYRDQYFEPGDPFIIDSVVEIRNNPSWAQPHAVIYCLMEEDAQQLEYDSSYQPYYKQWDSAEVDYTSGKFRIRANGWLPYFFSEPWDYRHYFRIYLSIEFGPGAETLEVFKGSLYDAYGGEQRITDDPLDRLIVIDRSYSWEIDRDLRKYDRTRPFD